MAILKVTKLSKQFTSSNRNACAFAVNDLSMEISSGEIFALIGPNGSGKTTTIKMIAGLYMPTSGIIEIEGMNTALEPEKAKAITGYIPDEPFIYEKMSGREFLGFAGALFGMTSSQVNKESAPILARFPGLEEVIDGYAEQYSRGNRQKLAIVSALMHKPKLLLVDEPMVGLDPQSALETKVFLKNFASKGGAVLLCTHTLSVAEELANRIGVLDKGRMIAKGSLDDLRVKAGEKCETLEQVYMELVSKKQA
jgi:ABC-2 type transport system ATP-binding protein